MRGFALALLAAAVALCGCDPSHMMASVSSEAKPYEEYAVDPVGLVSIRAIAILPFEDRTRDGTFNSEEFAERFANQLAGEGVFRVLYPSDVIGDVARDNARAARDSDRARHNARYGIRPESDYENGDGHNQAVSDADSGGRAGLDPIRREEQAVRFARKAGADAVIVGYVTEADPYMRPRLSLTLRLIATGRAENAAEAIAELTQWGVPRPYSGDAGSGLILTRQQNYDSREGNIGREVSTYGRTHHTDNHPYNTEAYLRSSRLYYDVVGRDIAKALVSARKAAVKESEKRAKEAAKRAKKSEAETQSRLAAIIDRDERIPDFEDANHPPAYFDQAFPDERLVLAGAGDRRVRSFRPNGPDLRRATPQERERRDNREIDQDGRILAMGGFGPMPEDNLPDPDYATRGAAADRRDKSWRPDVYNAAHPAKAIPLYDPSQRDMNAYE